MRAQLLAAEPGRRSAIEGNHAEAWQTLRQGQQNIARVVADAAIEAPQLLGLRHHVPQANAVSQQGVLARRILKRHQVGKRKASAP